MIYLQKTSIYIWLTLIFSSYSIHASNYMTLQDLKSQKASRKNNLIQKVDQLEEDLFGKDYMKKVLTRNKKVKNFIKTTTKSDSYIIKQNTLLKEKKADLYKFLSNNSEKSSFDGDSGIKSLKEKIKSIEKNIKERMEYIATKAETIYPEVKPDGGVFGEQDELISLFKEQEIKNEKADIEIEKRWKDYEDELEERRKSAVKKYIIFCAVGLLGTASYLASYLPKKK